MNKNIWNLYKNSERGRRTIQLFTFDPDKDNLENKLNDIYNEYGKYIDHYDNRNLFIDLCHLILENIIASNIFLEENEKGYDYFNRLVEDFELVEVEVNSKGEVIGKKTESQPLIKKHNYKELTSTVHAISLILYLYGEDFFPVLFREQFDVFLKTLDVLNIVLPKLPSKADKKGRLLFYNNINQNLNKFAIDNNLSPAETCACIYDFALMLLDNDNSEISELPEPTNIWLTGASKYDYENFLKDPNIKSTSMWTCNERTRRGDIIILYVLSPYSFIHSIWRADIDGVYTPFNYYNSRTRIRNGKTIPTISIKELKNHHYFSKLPIVRRNLQGVNGIQFSHNDYKELLLELESRDFDISTLPTLYTPELDITDEIKLERDVEEKLLTPLLEELGYNSSDWTRQLTQKAGRNEKAIPDFVFFPKGDLYFQNAPLVIEAKYDMSSDIERTKSYEQALSYARMMRASIFGICDKERLIIYKEKNNYFNRFQPAFEDYWQNITKEEVFQQLKILIGKEHISKL